MRQKYLTILLAMLMSMVGAKAENRGDILNAPKGASDVVQINEENFPDENFRNYLLQQDYGQDGKLTEDEINGITSIVVVSSNISSLQGIEYFTALTYLDCYNNLLTSLDVSNNTALTSLSCHINQINGEAMDELISGLPQNETDETYRLRIYYSGKDGNVCTKAQVAAVKAKGWTPYYCNLNVMRWLEYEGSDEGSIIEINEENFPDENFRNWLLQQNYSRDGKLTEDEINGITYISVGSSNISSLKGIEYFTALTNLYCMDNQLTSLDVSNNTALTYLYCYSNQLTSLDVSNNTALDWLDCSSNQLTSLDVSNNTALTYIQCYSNQIKGEAMDALISGLPQNETDNTYHLGIYYSGNDDNVCTKAQVAAAKAKGWTPYYTTEGQYWYEYEGSDEGSIIEINEENFPDENFRTYLLQQDYGQDGKLTEDEINGITTINVGSSNISSLQGIEYFTALTYLSCSSNELTSLDVSKNTALAQLECTYNQLTNLDISNNTALTRLLCGVNQLTSLDVTNNTALEWFSCYDNQLTSLDVSNNTALKELSCHNNQLTSLDVSNNTALMFLYCPNNQLTSLDVSNNTALTSLSCHNNQLTSLNVSKSSALTYIQCYSNQIKGEAMDALISGLSQNETDKTYPIYVYYSGNDDNVCTKAQVAATKAKGWIPYYTTNGEEWLEYEGSDEGSDGINAVSTDKQGNTAIYTLDGKRMNTTNAADLPKGIYIVNGKKVVIK